MLDLSRQEVVDCIYEQVATILRSANITYVKWDMNRQLTDIEVMDYLQTDKVSCIIAMCLQYTKCRTD